MYMIETQNGKFRFCEKYRALDGKQRTASITLDRNTPQSRKEAQKQLFDLIANKTLRGTETRLSELQKAYTEAQKSEVKASTWTRNESSLKRLVKIIGDVQVNDLTAGFIRDRITNYTKNPTTFNNYVRHLKAMLNWGFANDYLRKRLCIDKLSKKKEPSAKSKVQDKYLEHDELTAVLEAVSPFYGLIIRFQVLTGMRIGEIIALNDSDITGENITVDKTYDYRNKIITTPKSEDSNRLVSIQPELAAVIAEIRKTSKINRLRSGSRIKRFIVGPFGDALSYDKFNRIFASTTEKVIGRRLTTHALRHTHVAFMTENGIPLEVITRRIGHSDSKITKEIYMHVTKKLRKHDADLIAKVAIF